MQDRTCTYESFVSTQSVKGWSKWFWREIAGESHSQVSGPSHQPIAPVVDSLDWLNSTYIICFNSVRSNVLGENSALRYNPKASSSNLKSILKSNKQTEDLFKYRSFPLTLHWWNVVHSPTATWLAWQYSSEFGDIYYVYCLRSLSLFPLPLGSNSVFFLLINIWGNN